ncbi:type VI secretion system-associated protein TagF [Halomonas cupida]|uniref:Type VI secretion system protein ImpM n=1 Tax=Halomonas cupida TaxID=44933 RepID=A0A1M7DUE2_9GAMM|nr:type VI secretion system-associated protein TagF [Halomonas cupida]GEN22973.1 type VI secretion-associated protein [Halomonas cupida]SHL83115.1 type VI secretion system protein ImpM [Halomonas cupida]
MIGYFGKVPGSADFVAHNAAYKDVRELDSWLQHALARMAEHDSDWQDQFDALPTCFFHFRASNGYWLLGGLHSSRDASGRRYPLLIFQRFSVAPQVEGSVGVHTLSETFAGQLRELLQRTVHGEASVDELHQRVDELRGLGDADVKLQQRLLQRFLDDVRFSDLIKALEPSFPEFIANAFALRMQVLRQELKDGARWQAVLPLPAERALKRPAADLWLHWLEHQSPQRAKASLLVDDFMRPRLWRFASADHEAFRLLAGASSRGARIDVLEAFEEFDPRWAEITPPPAELDMGTYITRFPDQENPMGSRGTMSW